MQPGGPDAAERPWLSLLAETVALSLRCASMTGTEAAFWGLVGGFLIEGVQFSGAIRKTGGWPWLDPGEPGPWPFAASVLIRLGVGTGLASAVAHSQQINAFIAVIFGIAAPLIVETLSRHAPRILGLSVPTSASEPSGTPTKRSSITAQSAVNRNSDRQDAEVLGNTDVG